MKSYKDINGTTINEGDVVMYVAKDGRHGMRCKARLVAKPQKLTNLALVAVTKGGFESHIPTANEQNMLTVVGSGDSIDHEKAKSLWKIARPTRPQTQET